MSTRSADHVSLVLTTQTEAGDVYKVKGRAVADTANHPMALKPAVHFGVKVSGGSGWVKLYDPIHGVTLAEQEVTNTSPQNYDVELENWTDGELIGLECQIKSDGINTITLYECSVEVI